MTELRKLEEADASTNGVEGISELGGDMAISTWGVAAENVDILVPPGEGGEVVDPGVSIEAKGPK